MNDDSDDDGDLPTGSAGPNSAVSAISDKLDQDPGSNEFVNVIAPEEDELAVKGRDNMVERTVSVADPPKPIPHVAAEKVPPIIDNAANTSANIPTLTDETLLYLEPEPMLETELTELVGVRGDDDEPRMPGSFDMPTSSSTNTQEQQETSWIEILGNLRLK